MSALHKHAYWLAAFVIFLTPLTSTLPRGVPIPIFRLNEVILLAAFGLLLLYSALAGTTVRARLFQWTWLDPLFGLLFVTGTLLPLAGLELSGETFALANAARLFDLLQFYLVYRILMVVIDSPKKILACALALIAAGVVLAVIGILEAGNVPPVREWIQSYYPSFNLERNIAIGYPRVVSLLGSPQAYGAFLALAVFLCLTLLLYAPAAIPRRAVSSALVICLLGFIPTGAYSAILGAVLMFGLLLLFYRRLPRWVWGSGALVLAVGGIVFAPQIIGRLRFQFRVAGAVLPATLQARLEHWTTALQLLKPSDWLLGFRGALPPTLFSFENQYIAFLFRGGVLFLAAYVYFLVRAGSEAYRLYARAAEISKALALCTLIVLVGLASMSLSDSYFTNSGVSDAVWTLVALTAVAGRMTLPAD